MLENVQITIIISCVVIIKMILILLYKSKCRKIRCGKIEIERDVSIENDNNLSQINNNIV